MAESKSGDLGITACTGLVDLKTVEGAIRVGRSPGGANISSIGGDIEIQQAGGDTVIKGETSNVKVHFAYPIAKPSDLYTNGANIIVILDPRSQANLDAHSSVLGSVQARDLVIPGYKTGDKPSRLVAKLNGGGPAIVIVASGGYVSLRGETPLVPIAAGPPG
jgi:hypothetical protein